MSEHYDKFEMCYEPDLRLPTKLKKELIKHGWAVYVYNDKGETVGESYGARPGVTRKLFGADDLEYAGCEEYCYSTTVLPGMRGHGLGLELAKLSLIATYPRSLCGHATTEGMRHIRAKLGAVFPRPPIEDYFGTGRTAHYYEHKRGHNNAEVREKCQ